MSSLRRMLACLLLTTWAAAAWAHEGSTSYLEVDATGSPEVSARWDIAVIDLAFTLALDADGDGRLAWGEIESRTTQLQSLLAGGLDIERGGSRCTVSAGRPWLTERLGLPYLSFDVVAGCTAGGPLRITSSLFFDGDAYHRVLVSVAAKSGTHAATLAPGLRTWNEPAEIRPWRTAFEFLRQGMVHVWSGYDHLVFLFLLLLPAVVSRGKRADSRAIALDLARIVTAFTVAHSITLGLAATGVIRLPQQPIEVAIAVTLVVAGILNLAPGLWRLRLPLAFGFGLVHGFGFANALAGLDTGNASIVPVLGGFNVGVEIANLAVIAVLLPFLLWSGRFVWYAPRAVPAMSLVSAALGALWMIQRL